MLLAGQGVVTAATPGTSGSKRTALVSGGDNPTGDDDNPTGDDGNPAGDAGNPAGDDGESTGDDDNSGLRPTRAQSPTVQALTPSVATSRTKSVLSRRFGQVYTHGSHKRVSCRPQGTSSYVCSLSWRYRQQRYNGRAIVTRSGPVKTHVVSRRAR
jgi:hypothetical protein